jgi:protein-L-isoaspartate(D-aspartate) O-methyltransferase
MTSPASLADSALRDGPIAARRDLGGSLEQRQTMIDCQIRTFDVTDQVLLARLMEVPRERLVPDDVRDLAYSDIGFSIKPKDALGEARYLLPPMVLARLIQGGRVKPTDKVLDVACGAGYSTAILAGLATSVIALEADADLVSNLRARLASVDLSHVRCLEGELAEGSRRDAPFDVILINGAVETGLDSLFAQLAEGGRLIAIRRDLTDPTGRAAKAICYEKRGGEIGSRYLFDASAPVLRAFRRAPRFTF